MRLRQGEQCTHGCSSSAKSSRPDDSCTLAAPHACIDGRAVQATLRGTCKPVFPEPHLAHAASLKRVSCAAGPRALGCRRSWPRCRRRTSCCGRCCSRSGAPLLTARRAAASAHLLQGDGAPVSSQIHQVLMFGLLSCFRPLFWHPQQSEQAAELHACRMVALSQALRQARGHPALQTQVRAASCASHACCTVLPAASHAYQRLLLRAWPADSRAFKGCARAEGVRRAHQSRAACLRQTARVNASYFDSYGDFSIHRTMLEDRVSSRQPAAPAAQPMLLAPKLRTGTHLAAFRLHAILALQNSRSDGFVHASRLVAWLKLPLSPSLVAP